MIPYGRQSISQDDIDAVIRVLKSDYLTQGPVVPLFEEAVAKHVGGKFGVAVNSATSALHISCLALGVGKGDIVWTSAITFVASANCALYCGASVDFIDIESETYNMSIPALEEKLISAQKNGQLPKVVIPVHLCGQSCDMKAISELGVKYGFKIIEDASHGIGGKYEDDFIGSCKYSDITVFSFHPVKIITSAEGGMCLTNDASLANKIQLLRTHGITRAEDEMQKPSEGAWYYEQVDLGFNYRMTEMQGALGLSQLDKLNQFVRTRNKIAREYIADFSDSVIGFQKPHPGCLSAYHLFVIEIPENYSSLSKKQIFEVLRGLKINVNLHYIPVYRHPFYKRLNIFNSSDYPNAEAYYSKAISIPIYPDLTEEQRVFIVNSVQGLSSL
jgi:UDP-4-amino-4,6-dideoxy-N-acetyl-beta-L-altrosamine transaminase